MHNDLSRLLLFVMMSMIIFPAFAVMSLCMVGIRYIGNTRAFSMHFFRNHRFLEEIMAHCLIVLSIPLYVISFVMSFILNLCMQTTGIHPQLQEKK